MQEARATSAGLPSSAAASGASIAAPQPKLERQGALFKQVCEYLRLRWSPQQLAGQLKTPHPHNRSQRVSHESIYTCLYAQPRGKLKKELLTCLRMARAKR